MRQRETDPAATLNLEPHILLTRQPRGSTVNVNLTPGPKLVHDARTLFVPFIPASWIHTRKRIVSVDGKVALRCPKQIAVNALARARETCARCACGVGRL